MAQEATQTNTGLSHRLDALLKENRIDDPEELIRVLDVISEKLKMLENHDVPSADKKTVSGNASPPEMKECTFKDMCYTARFKAGSCPCELKK